MIKLNTKEHNIWFSSDIHGLHKNICYGTSNWDDKETNCRMFDNPNEMTDHIIDNFNRLVQPEDHLFLLGDLLFHYKDVDSYNRFIRRFNCENIYLLFGNHDHRTNLEIACIDLNCIKFLGDYFEITIDGRMICLCHYPFSKWNDRHKTSLMLYGHEHGRYDNGEMSMDVGVDNIFKLFGEYKPINWKEVKKLMKI